MLVRKARKAYDEEAEYINLLNKVGGNRAHEEAEDKEAYRVMKQIEKQFEYFRIENDLTKKDLATMMRIHPVNYYRYFKNQHKNDIQLKTLTKYARRVGLKVEIKLVPMNQ